MERQCIRLLRPEDYVFINCIQSSLYKKQQHSHIKIVIQFKRKQEKKTNTFCPLEKRNVEKCVKNGKKVRLKHLIQSNFLYQWQYPKFLSLGRTRTPHILIPSRTNKQISSSYTYLLYIISSRNCS